MLGSSGYLPEVFLQGSTAEISCNWNRYRIKGGTTMNPCLMVPSLRISPISEDHSKTCLVPSYGISSSEHMRSPRFPTCAVGPYPPPIWGHSHVTIGSSTSWRESGLPCGSQTWLENPHHGLDWKIFPLKAPFIYRWFSQLPTEKLNYPWTV